MLIIILMEFSYYLILLTANFLQNLNQLISFLITFLFIRQITKIKNLNLLIITNLIKLFLICCSVQNQLLLSPMQGLRIILLLPLHTYICIPIQSLKCYIMLLALLSLKPNYLLLGTVSIKLSNSKTSSTLLLLLTQFMWLTKYPIHLL